MPRPHRPCPDPGCPELIGPGQTDCVNGHARAKRTRAQRATDARRPTAAQRGYDHTHRTRFRAAVLRRDPTCVLCRTRPSQHADHHPLTRTELVAQDLDPNDPRHGRGLCASCHATETARHDGGFGNTRRPTQP